MTLPATGRLEQPEWLPRAHRRARTLILISGVLSLLVIVEWLLETDVLIRVFGTAHSTKFLTALSALIIASALLTQRTAVRRAALAVSGVIGLLVLIEHLAGVNLGIDQFLLDDWTSAGGPDPGRPAPGTAIGLLLISGAGLFASVGRYRLGQLSAVLALGLSITTAFGYLFAVPGVNDATANRPLPLTAAVLIGLLAVAVLYEIPGSPAQWITYGTDAGARFQRAVLPLLVTVLPGLKLIQLVGQEKGWFDLRTGAALIAAVTTGVGIILVYWLAVGARRFDLERENLLGEIRRINHELENRVRVRSHEVNRQRTKLALLEERDRIARDLHDRVIQRIFAAGLQIGGLSRAVGKLTVNDPESRLPGQLDGIATELDLAIRELRNSIFQLTSIDDHQDMEQVVRDILTRSSRILGFMPRVTVTGQLDGIRADLVGNLASAIQEGLSNVARHARATSAEVVLEGTDREVVVRITDDGIGLPDPLPRSSGISNLLNRARSLGGDASWKPNQPTGTIFTWSIARDGEVNEFYGNDASATLRES